MQGRVGSQEGRQGRAQQHRDVEQDACCVKQQAQEGPVVAESHAAAQQAAVVIPTKDADAAGGAMPTARWHLALALVAVTAGKEPQRQFRQQLGMHPSCPLSLGAHPGETGTATALTASTPSSINAGRTPLPGPFQLEH